MDAPRLRDSVLYLLVSALCAYLADRYESLLAVAGTVIFGSAGVVMLVNWMVHEYSLRLRDVNKAKTEGTTTIAYALKGLTMQQTDIVARHDMVTIAGLVGSDGVQWVIKAPGGDIPWRFMVDFLVKTQETNPYLFPIRRHDEFDWPNSEQLCTLATNLIKSCGWAERASGPYAARLTTSLAVVAGKFGLDND